MIIMMDLSVVRPNTSHPQLHLDSIECHQVDVLIAPVYVHNMKSPAAWTQALSKSSRNKSREGGRDEGNLREEEHWFLEGIFTNPVP